MVNGRTRALGIVVWGGASLLLAGCAGGADEGDAADEPLTLESLMGVPSDEDFDFASTVDQIEASVALCMADEGWNYIPFKLPTEFSAVAGSDEDEVERIKLEGIGFTYYLLNNGGAEAGATDPSAAYVDPNVQYVATLTEAERTAYEASLYGTEEEQAADETTVIDRETGEETTVALGSVGCRGEARDEFYGDDPAHDPNYKLAMQAYWDELDARTEADPRFAVLDAEWSACMEEAGYEYESPDQYADAVYFEFQERTDEVVGPDFYADPTEGWTQAELSEFWASATEEDVAELYGNRSELTADQRARLEAIFGDEVAVALAEHECSKDFDQKARDVAADVEEQFALEHEDELRALAASLFGES